MKKDFNFIYESINSLNNKINNALEDKFREAMTLYGVDLLNNNEISRRCEIHSFGYDGNQELRIDGKLVMIFTYPKPKKFDPFNETDPYKFEASFACSEIIKPIDYENTKTNNQ